TGFKWDTSEYGSPVFVEFLPSGLIVGSTVGVKGERQGRLYHLDDISSDPILKYEAPPNEDSYFVGGFGLSTHTNGLQSMVLVGVYGRDDVARDLLLSVDGGKSYKVVKKTRNNDATVNSHWHGVAIDHYSGFIWAGEGDGPNNRAIHFS